MNTSNASSKDDQTITNFFHKKDRKKRGKKNRVKILTFKTSHTAPESLVITCLLFLKTWNFLMLGAPVYK